MIVDSLQVGQAEFERGTGWDLKPEGACRGDVCVPLPDGAMVDGSVDVATVAQRLGMPVVEDRQHGLWALGPATVSGRALSTAVAADPELIARDGSPFRLSSLHGRKVLLVAWSSY
ncbi:MAG: putative Thiol:disulfide interchange protein [Actinomycetota bacterium]|jgi:hypothetical protein